MIKRNLSDHTVPILPKCYLIGLFIEQENERNPEWLEIKYRFLTAKRLISSIGSWCESPIDAMKFYRKHAAQKFVDAFEKEHNIQLCLIPVRWNHRSAKIESLPLIDFKTLPVVDASIINGTIDV